MKVIDYIYKNFKPLAFSKFINKYNYDYSIDLSNLILKSVKDIHEIKNEINLWCIPMQNKCQNLDVMYLENQYYDQYK